MKNLILTLLVLLSIQNAFSQVKNIEYSTPFTEPEKGWYKVMQLSNGNTFFFDFNNDGVSVTVYKPDRKLAARKNLTSSLWNPKDMKNSTMEGIYEINGEPVIFLQQLNSRQPTLYRIQLNPDNGSISQQQEIGRLPKYKLMSGYALALGGVDPEDFVVEKDPQSDAYAVMHYNSFAHESDKRIELVHYTIKNGKHIEINRAFYGSQGFKYTNYIGMCVTADKSIHMAAYGYNTKASGGEDSRVIISRVSPGEKSFTHKNIEFTDDFKETDGLMVFNPYTNIIQLFTLTYVKKEKQINYLLPYVSYIDPQTLQVLKKVTLPIDGMMAYMKSKSMTEDDEYRGTPVNMLINSDHSTTFLLEDKTEMSINSSSTAIGFGNIGVVKLDHSGKETESFGIMKKQVATGHPTELFYHAKRGKGLWSYVTRRGTTMYTPEDNRSFYSYDYINTSTNNTYIIYNDHRDNYIPNKPINRSQDLNIIKRVSESIATFKKIQSSKIDTDYLFGKPANDNVTAFCNVESAHFRKETGVYASLMVKRNGREKKAYISWVTFE